METFYVSLAYLILRLAIVQNKFQQANKRKFQFFSKFDMNIGWGKSMPIDFELQQGLPCVFPNLPNLILHITKAGIRA